MTKHTQYDNLNKAQSSLHHSFDAHLANLYGVNEAILIHHFQFWIQFNKNMNRNNKGGRTWMYQTTEEMAAHFPYFTYEKIRNIIRKLVKFKVISKGNFNKSKMDTTTWYSFVDEDAFLSVNKKMFAECENSQMGCEISQSDGEISQVIPDTKTTDTKTQIKEDTGQTVSPTPTASAPPLPKVPKKEISFSFETGEFVNMTTKDIEAFEYIYKHIDVKRELKAMEQWALSNLSKSKSRKNWRAFITRWLKSGNDYRENKEAYRASKAKQTCSRHQGFQNDNSPVNPKRVHDFSEDY